MTTQTLTKAVQQRPNATSRKKRAQPSKTRLPVLRPVVADTFSPTWATGIMRFSTIYGALNITNEQLQALKSVPRDGPREDRPTYAHVARTRSGMASRGRRITFTIQGGAAAAYIAGYGMPVYALATVSESELLYHMQSPLDTVMPLLGTRNIRIRIQWPCPRDGRLDRFTFEESVMVDESTTRLRMGMLAAQSFCKFFEKNRVKFAGLADYDWLLRPDALHRVWLVELERVENDVYAADLRYVKDYPDTP
ncbi:uncharacterized protein TRAVEDRAFT_46299 [Trametes versicolor FP-101664 SS1]|uniref:uncharacterized protein n=1 Tax=Trametes versicolor (strain FP-101664) TaxID=717944 RepID=UPI0004621BC5|nr:uncharacterized protein TRAVEDRAFT_46299 [Trametes versicolor FP-101664 SS1]EIW61075.1 hypothetical protein TRAVEDRAFT_46299 [Trametes versicolor FP-101664 SS1]